MNPKPTSFLGGCRVLDLSDHKGHFCGKILGDIGADVIKIEPPGGDPARNRGPFYQDIPDAQKSLTWFFSNLNKRGITLNLETVDGKEMFAKLVKTADFVLESFEPGVMEKLGLGYPSLEKIKPSLIVVSISPFGQTGPYAKYKTTDLVGTSMGGLIRLFGELDSPPVRFSAPQFYLLGCLHGAMGAMVAHYHRELTGEGQHVDVSCQQATVLANRISVETWDLLKINPRGIGPHTLAPRPTPPGPIFVPIIKKCKDGYVVAFILGGANAAFVKSSRALVKLANQEGIAMELKDFEWEKMDFSVITQEEVNRLNDILGEFLLTKTKEELLNLAVQNEIFLIPVNTIRDLADSRQLKARQFWKTVRHPELDDALSYPAWPVKWTRMPDYEPQCRPPLIGEHNPEIYEKELGLSKEQITMLKSQGAI